MDQIKSQVDNLAEIGDEQVAALQEAIVSEFESFESQDPTAETVDAMTSLADMLDTVRGEVQRREAAAEELTARAAEAAMRVKGMDGQEESPMEEEVPMEEEAPVEEVPVVEETPMEEEEAPAMGSDSEDMVPGEEDEEKKKKDYKSSYSSTDSVDASAVVAEGSELSIETETAVEASVAETTPTEEEAVVASAEEPEEVVTEEVATEAETPSETIAPEEQEEQAIVTASAEQPFEAPADRQPVIEVSEPAVKVAITAGADIPGYTAGTNLTDMNEVASAMEKRLHTLRRVNGGDGEQHIVASLTVQYPESRTLTTDAESNAIKISAVAEETQALVASGGHGAPFEVKYDIFGLGSTTDRPVRDALPRFQADRGGIRFVTPPSFITYNATEANQYNYRDAVGVWTAANDSAETPSPAAKLSYTVTAAAENTVSTDAVTLQLQFGNLMTRAYPELIARHNELALVQHAREAELNLLSKISTGSTAVNAHVATTEAANLIGFARDFLVQVRKAAVAYRSRHRIDAGTRLKAIVPAWIYDAMAADLALNMPGDGSLGVGETEIKGYLSSSNVDMVSSLDLNAFTGQAGSAARLLEFPDQITWYLFAEGTFLFLDGGTLDLGIESLAITTSLSINGVAAALRDTTGGATAAAIED